MLRLDDLQVDSFATTHAALVSAGTAAAQAIPTTGTVPYSMLGSCYDCPSNVTICPATDTGSTVA